MSKSKKTLLIFFLLAAILLLSAFTIIYRQEISLYHNASRLLKDLDYIGAAEAFSEFDFLNSSSKSLEAYYLAAEEFENNDSPKAAYELYLKLGDYKDSPQHLILNGSRYAEDLVRSGKTEEACRVYSVIGDSENADYYAAILALKNKDYEKALGLFTALGSYKNSALHRDTSLAGLYRVAQDTMARCEFEEAERLFRLCGEYEHSDKFLNYIDFRKNAVLPEESLFKGCHMTDRFEKGALYFMWDYYFYVPYECDENTKFCIYFAGGAGEPILQYCTVMDYFFNFKPNAIMLFCITSGYKEMEFKIDQTFQMLNELSLRENLAIHDLAIVGSSLGCATAMRAAPYYYENFNIVPVAVGALDNAMNWEIPGNLTAEERASLAEAGTICYLYEQSTELNCQPLRDLVDSKCKVVMIECKNNGHDAISVDGFVLGCFDSMWSGEFDPKVYTPKYYF